MKNNKQNSWGSQLGVGASDKGKAPLVQIGDKPLMSLAAHLLAAQTQKRGAAKLKELHSQQPAAKRNRVALAVTGEAARGPPKYQPGTNGASAAHTGAPDDSGEEPDVEAGGGQASYEALLRSLHASCESRGAESGSGSSSDSEGEHALGSASVGGRKGLKVKAMPAPERERQAARSVEPSRSQAARARAQLDGAAADSLGASAASRAEQLDGARPAPAAAPALGRDGEADHAGAAWGQRMEQHFGRCVAVGPEVPALVITSVRRGACIAGC